MQKMFFFILAAGALGWNVSAQTNKVPVTIYVSTTSAALIGDLQSNGVPIDTVLAIGARAALGQAQTRLQQQLRNMTFEQLAAAYPALLPLVDTNDAPLVQWQALQQLAQMQVSRARTAAGANEVAAKHLAAMLAKPKPNIDTNAASQRLFSSTNLFQNPSSP